VFLRHDALPGDAAARDRALLRIVGAPDAYGTQIDGMGGGTSSTSKVVLVAKSRRPDCDVEFLFGAVAIDAPVIDWSGNCGNLTAAVGPYAIAEGLVPAQGDGVVAVRIWQANIGKRIVAHVPVRDGAVVEDGAFEVAGVAFPGAEIRIEFLDPAGGSGSPLFPSGRVRDALEVDGVGTIQATLINAGNPTAIVEAGALGLVGTEGQRDVNADAALLDRCERVRAQAAVAMGLAASPRAATRERPATPKLAFVAAPSDYVASDGRVVAASRIDVLTRILSMGRLHHALTGTGAVALAVAGALPGTVLRDVLAPAATARGQLRFGHPSGVLTVGADARSQDDRFVVDKVTISRTARRLMAGRVFWPEGPGG
jgi:probable AcnD-accessory protein PrpF